MAVRRSLRPRAQSAPIGAGLYDPAHEHDGCGVAAVARLDRAPTHEVIKRALETLDNLEHRGAAGADASTGDGAGILFGLPHEFIVARVGEFGLGSANDVPPSGEVGIAMVFVPTDDARRAEVEKQVEQIVEAEGQRVLGWRDVPSQPGAAGETSRACMPAIRQLLVGAGEGIADQDAFERKLFVIRRVAELAIGDDIAFASFSSRTVTYKGMLTAPQLNEFYPDLRDPAMSSLVAIVHSRFSTNTFPSWKLAHPYRMTAHNGEINTLQGNVNWMRAREAALSSPLFGEDIERCTPLIPEGSSDSAAFDHVFELLVQSGRSLPHALMMMIPRAYEERPEVADEIAGFYRYHSRLIEPWDGPAGIIVTDGRMLCATLDRNGLRPGRWLVTNDGWVAISSEAGSFHAPDENILKRSRLRPVSMLAVDLIEGRVLDQGEAEMAVAGKVDWDGLDAERTVAVGELPDPESLNGSVDWQAEKERPSLREGQLSFGYSQEDLKVILSPMARDGKEPTGSMGNDLALALFSDASPSLFAYFKQRFAQVTNPAIDSVREHVVMSLRIGLGPETNLLEEGAEPAPQLVLDRPVLDNEAMAAVHALDQGGLRSAAIDITWPVADGADGLDAAIEAICSEASAAIAAGANVLILSDRKVGAQRVAIPSLLATAAVHHHLVRTGERVHAGLAVESGEPREVHHVAALLGYGAGAVNPYLMLDSVADLAEREEIPTGIGPDEARTRTIAALDLGLLKVLSKMGISTVHSYCGAQIFEAVGLDQGLIERCFTGTPSNIGGIGLAELGQEAMTRHARAWPESHGLALAGHVEEAMLPSAHTELLPQGGVYAWRRDGERHMWDPPTIASLQRATRPNGNGSAKASYDEFCDHVNRENAQHGLIRGLLKMCPLGDEIDIDEVESATEVVKRFSTGAMSLGALSPEAHETLAIAMNSIGGRSNSGEGGEDPRRFKHEAGGIWRRSAIKQVASGRFGVTAHYLANADQIQIKIAQGAKPGEGGQLPGHKVDEYIARLRFSTPGVELISPPPHHDIYSIEDLKQLIFDLRTANPKATISVKLASEVGVGTVAAGVVKAGADHVVIAGHDGGTGASPQSSIQSAGVPWELGLAETQQILLENDLRSRILIQIDGQMRTGRDVLVAALLGADEFGFSTAPLIATGCIMMRVCHLNTCPVGIASQDPELRRRFAGKPEHVVNYLFLVAEEVRSLLARLGAYSLDELIGRVDMLETDAALDHWKAHGVDLSRLLANTAEPGEMTRHNPADRVIPDELDPLGLAEEARGAVRAAEKIRIERDILNTQRAVGGVLSHEIVSAHGPAGLEEGSIDLAFKGSGGQSFGAWLAPGVTIDLQGEANDYCGKGLSGGIVAIRPPEKATYVAEDNVIVGNVALYGATAGRAFFRGRAGERFAVRNSGASAVVEGIGDHGCEYMTGGRVVVIGPTGHNFGAGMTGGIAYVWDPEGKFPPLCNHQLVDLDPMTYEDRGELRELLMEHRRRTGSEQAEKVLEGGVPALDQFVKVTPREYKRVIAKRAQLATVGVTA